MSRETKRTSLLCLIGALISLVLLSGSLSNLELHRGTPFPGVDPRYSQTATQEFHTYSFPAIPGIFVLILLVLTVYVLIRLIMFVNLKWLLPWLFRSIIALAVLFVLLLILSYLNFDPTTDSEWLVEVTASDSITSSPLGRPPKEFIWFVALGFVFATVLLIVKIFGQRVRPPHPENPLLKQAKNAMQDLQAGHDFRNVIIRCYVQMTNMLQAERGIERNGNMTAREFQDWLEFKGLPRVPVQKLTDLFEKVRYGKQHLGENDEKIALDSLSEIIQFAERTQDEALAN